MPIDNLLLKIRNQTNSFTPSDYSATQPMQISNISNVSNITKPSFSEITPFSENTVYETLSSGEKIPMFENFIPGTDNQERLAQNQTASEKWANGAKKFLLKTGDAVLGGTVGVVYGIGSGISNGSWDSIYDNDFSNWLADLDTKLNYQLPNYYTKQEQEAGVFGQLGTANFWADKFLGGLSFTAGAIVSEGIWAWATGGTSLATAGARLRWGVDALGEAKTISSLSNFKKIYKDLPIGNLINKNKALALGKTGEALSTAGFMIRSAGYEASVEALQFKKEAEENFYNSFKDRQPTAEEVAEFEKNLTDASNAVFFTNLGILGVSNAAMFGNVFDIKNPIKTGIGEFIDRKAFGYGVDKATLTALKPTRTQNILRNVFDYGVKSSFTEGIFEEGLQGVTTKTANKWIEHSYNPQNTSETFEMVNALGQSLAEQYGSEEGWKENILGMLIGVLGGSINVASEQKQKQQKYEMAAKVGETFKAEGETLQSALLGFRIQTANRIQGFTEDAKKAQAKGDISKASLAQKSAILTYVNAKQTLGESTESIVSEMKKSLDLISESQWAEIGVQPQDISSEKESRLTELKDLANQWKTNKKYWQYMIGKKLVGEQNLEQTALEEGLGSNFSKNAQIIEALAWQTTIGENAHKQIKDIQEIVSKEIGSEAGLTMSTLSKLKRQSSNVKGQITKASLQYNELSKERDNLTKQIAKLNNTPKPTEGDSVRGAQLATLNNRLLEVTDKLQELSDLLEQKAQEITKTENYSKELGDIELTQELITGRDLIDLNKNLQRLESTINSFDTTNPQRKEYLTDLLDEYNQLESVFEQSLATQKVILSKDFKLENIGSWIGGKLAGKKEMNLNTKEWLQDAINTYSKYKTKALSTEEQTQPVEEQVADNKDAKPKTETVEVKEPLTDLELYKQRIENLLKRDFHNLTFIGDDYSALADKKPTKEEVDEYLNSEKVNRELEKKLSNWKLLDSAVDSENVSIAQMVDLIKQLETQIEIQDTKDEVTNEDIVSITDEISGTNITDDYTLAQNTLGSATVVKPSNLYVYRLSHIKAKTIVNALGGWTQATINNKTLRNENELDKLKPNDVISIDNFSFLYLPKGVLEIKIDDFNARQQALNLYIVDTGALKWTYKDLYTVKGNDFVKMKSDFIEDIDSEAIYELQPQDKLKLVIDDIDGFNKTKLGNSKEQLKIFLQDSKGRKVSTLKSLREGNVNEDFLLLRQEAYDRWVANDRPNKLNLGIEVAVENIFLGSPEIQMDAGRPKNISFTQKAVEQVLATGYIEQGELKLNKELQDVSKMYVSKLSKNTDKKIPLVVFKKGGYLLAYPITMVKTSTPQTDIFDGILSSGVSAQEKIIRINEQIQLNSIDTPKLTYSDINNEEKINQTRLAFEQKQTFVDAKTLATPQYNINRLVKDAVINIDLENLSQVISDAKIRISLKDVKYTTQKEIKYENMTDIENRLNDLALEVYKDYVSNAQVKYVNNKGEILEDTVFTNALDDNEVIKTDNQLQKIVETALGAQKTTEIKTLLKQYNFIKSQITVKEEDLDNGQNNIC